MLENNRVINFEVMQVKNGLTRKYAYMPLDFIIDMFGKVELKNYETVFVGASRTSKDIEEFLSELFHTFNVEHPTYYKGRSMSVSDIVKIDDRYFYCDSIGWEEIKF